MVGEERMRHLELQMEALVERVDGLEVAVSPAPASPAPTLPSPPPVAWTAPTAAPAVPEAPTPPKTEPHAPDSSLLEIPVFQRRPARAPRSLEDLLGGRSLEDLLGGRVLAWVGGLAVLIGVAFLFAVAVSSGWIGEGVRTLIAGTGAAALLAVGIWLHERHGQMDAALAAVATGVSALFVTLTVGAQVYEVLPASAALLLALGVGGVATALAVRWESQGIGALGILGGLVSPVLAGAPAEAETMAILLIAAASAVGVLLHQRWEWLSCGVFLVTVPQWALYLAEGQPALGVVGVLTGFGLIGAAAAAGYELRVRAQKVGLSSAFLLCVNATVLAAGGWLALNDGGHHTVATAWLAGLAISHIAIGLWGTRSRCTSHAFGLLALVLGALLADLAFALIVDGPLRAIGWAGAGVMFAALVRSRRLPERDEALTALGLGVHISLALMQCVGSDAPVNLLGVEGPIGIGAAISLASVAAGCLVSARLADAGHRELRVALDALGLALAAYLTALTLDGALLTLAWSVEAVALAKLASRTGDEVAGWGALAYLGGALAHALASEAPPTALVTGLEQPLTAAISLGAVLLGAGFCARWGCWRAGISRALLAGASITALYLISALLVTPFQSGGSAAEASPLDLDVRQQGQVLLSALWSLVGFGALVLGLRRDLRMVRLGALALLLVAVGKVFLFDLATLTSIYRVASFIGLGLFLLTAAFVWQRMRPKGMPDMRAVPEAIR